jgi:signal transduction histidine kinase
VLGRSLRLGRVRSTATSLWAEPAVRNPPPRDRRDWALAVSVLAAVALEVVARRDLVWPPLAAILGTGLALGVVFRRTHGLIAVAFAFGSFAALDVAAYAVGSDRMFLYSGAAVLVLAYSLFRWGSGRHAILGIGPMGVGYLAAVLTNYTGPADTVGGAAVLVFPAALAVSVRYRVAARRQLVEQAKFQEREQLARELHDTVAHHVTAIAIQAQAGLILARSSSLGGATEALEIINGEAAQTLAEMRTMVGALRDRESQPALTPQRGIADIERLAAEGTGALSIDVELCGELTNLSPAFEAALYRVAQEAVTNAQRHAHQATRVEVRVNGDAEEVQMTVDDDGARTTAARPPGYGLIGMTERVTLLGGTLTAGAKADGGWVVRAVLPRRGADT